LTREGPRKPPLPPRAPDDAGAEDEGLFDDRPTIEVDVTAPKPPPSSRRFDPNAPTIAPPAPPNEKRGDSSGRVTLTNEVELEAARLQSVGIVSSLPPRAPAGATASDKPERPGSGPFSLLSFANAQAPTEPPPQPRAGSTPDDGPGARGPRPPVAVAKDPADEMRDRFSLGDYTGALELAEGILASDPKHAEASTCAESARAVLLKMYTARIGPLDRVPFVTVPRHQLKWLTIDHRAGFVLSHIDGTSSLEMILDVSGMPPLDALRILLDLVQQRIVAFR
jgi:hypothetical protein